MRLFVVLFSTILLATAAIAEPPEGKGKPENPGKKPMKVYICHVEDVVEIDEDDGEKIVVDTIYTLLHIPEHAAAVHMANHGDFYPDLFRVNGLVDVMACEPPTPDSEIIELGS